MAEQTPDSIITTQRNGQTIVAELFFNHSSTETFRDKVQTTAEGTGFHAKQRIARSYIFLSLPYSRQKYVQNPSAFPSPHHSCTKKPHFQNEDTNCDNPY